MHCPIFKRLGIWIHQKKIKRIRIVFSFKKCHHSNLITIRYRCLERVIYIKHDSFYINQCLPLCSAVLTTMCTSLLCCTPECVLLCNAVLPRMCASLQCRITQNVNLFTMPYINQNVYLFAVLYPRMCTSLQCRITQNVNLFTMPYINQNVYLFTMPY